MVFSFSGSALSLFVIERIPSIVAAIRRSPLTDGKVPSA